MTSKRQRQGSPEKARPGESGDPRAGRDRPAEGLDKEPHHDLANPAEDPDPTEFPDPYERRPDPRGPEADRADPEREPSTSDPPPPRNIDRARKGEGEER